MSLVIGQELGEVGEETGDGVVGHGGGEDPHALGHHAHVPPVLSTDASKHVVNHGLGGDGCVLGLKREEK